MTQEQAILEHLRAGNSLSPMEALKLCNCWALSSRISDLHKKKHNIKSVMEKGENGKVYARYFLVDEPQDTEHEEAVRRSNEVTETKINYGANGQKVMF